MPEVILDETIHDDGGDNTEEDTSPDQAAVNDLGLGVHPLPLVTVREGCEARADKGVKE